MEVVRYDYTNESEKEAGTMTYHVRGMMMCMGMCMSMCSCLTCACRRD